MKRTFKIFIEILRHPASIPFGILMSGPFAVIGTVIGFVIGVIIGAVLF